MKKILNFILLFIVSCHFLSGQTIMSEKDVSVLTEPADTMMRIFLTRMVDKQFAVRDSLLSTLKTRQDWDIRKQVIRDSMISWTGPFPERTPLNARITGRIEREDYILEKILFESRPNYLVSANLYLPKNFSGPLPAQLNLIGHAQMGKADERYQRMSIAQAKNGFIVLTIDQLGQGERGVLSVHRDVGVQSFISGTHVFNFMVWDAIRSIDYLVSRPEVDAGKICVTGSSGGGMMTTYLLPFDDRIAVAVPTCNPNTWNYRVHANLATDHEQVFFGAFESSIDPRGDPLFFQTPKPMLLNTTTDDNLNPPRGVWDLNTWLYKLYSVYGEPEKLSTTMVKAGHAYNQEQREITYSWMRRWTGNETAGFWEEDVTLEKEEDLWAAEGGSIFNIAGNRHTHELVLNYLSEHKAKWREIEKEEDIISHKTEMTSLIKDVLNSDLEHRNLKYDFKKKRSVGDFIIRPFIIEPEPGIILPGFMLQAGNESTGEDVVLYLNENGKSNLLEEMDIVKEILSQGKHICAVDLRGIGETSPDMSNKFWDFLAGKPIFGQRVADVLSLVKWLKESEVKAQSIQLWGTGMCALYGAFAGVLSNDVSSFVFEKPLISFESVVRVNKPKYNYEILLPGILEKFDMVQVYQAICPRPVSVINLLSGDKSPAEKTEIENTKRQVVTTYRGLKKQKAWSVASLNSHEREKIIINFFEKN
ncbi:MAG: alpha/beta hydrolase [Bacteroidota bacterium]